MGRALYTQIYEQVCLIPQGYVSSYGRIAKLVGSTSPRVVGYAMAQAPDDVPWQRVVNSEGRISPRSNPDAETWQRILLEEEGVQFGVDGRIDMRRFGWPLDGA